MMRRGPVVLLLSVLLLHIGAPSADAQFESCPVVVFYGNGVDTSESRSLLSNDLLAIEVNTERSSRNLTLLPWECFVPAYATAGLPVGPPPPEWQQRFNDAFDLIESVFQVVTDDISLLIKTAFPGFANISYAINPDVQKQVIEYRNVLSQPGRRVVIVSHSQGNLFANEAFSVLTSGDDGQDPIPDGRLRIVSVATPQSYVAGTGGHTTLFGDIIRAVQIGKFANTEVEGTPCTGNVVTGQVPRAGARQCHDFTQSYLQGVYSRQRIVDGVVDVARVNTPPVAGFTLSSGLQSTVEGQTLRLVTLTGQTQTPTIYFDAGRSNDPDEPLASIQWEVDGALTHTFTFDRSLSVGPHSVRLVATDYDGATSEATATIVVDNGIIPTLPIAHDDFGAGYSVEQGGILNVPARGVMENDLNAGLARVEFVAPLPIGLTSPVSFTGAFTIDLTAYPTFTGPLIFQYVLHGSSGDSNRATVTVQVTPRTPAPVARGDSYNITQGETLRVLSPGVLGNDDVPSGATVEFLAPLPITLQAANPDGSFTVDLSFVPEFVGNIDLLYVIHSAYGDSNLGSVSIHVLPRTSADFFDNFNRPDGPVGNGWIDMASNAQGNLVVRNGALGTPGPNGYGGLFRPIDTSRPVTLSATFTYLNGFGGALYRYDTAFLFGSSGVGESGYGVLFTRGDQNYADSAVHLVYNGTVLQTLQSTFQFTDSISTTFTWSPNGSVVGSVSDQSNIFNFAFGARLVTLPGQNLAVRLGFPDGRSGVIVNPTVDNVTATANVAPTVYSQSTWDLNDNLVLDGARPNNGLMVIGSFVTFQPVTFSLLTSRISLHVKNEGPFCPAGLNLQIVDSSSLNNINIVVQAPQNSIITPTDGQWHEITAPLAYLGTDDRTLPAGTYYVMAHTQCNNGGYVWDIGGNGTGSFYGYIRP